MEGERNTKGILNQHFLVGLWKETEKRRQFFIDLAKAIGFDHMNAESWYSNWHTIWTIKVNKEMRVASGEAALEKKKKEKKRRGESNIY